MGKMKPRQNLKNDQKNQEFERKSEESSWRSLVTN